MIQSQNSAEKNILLEVEESGATNVTEREDIPQPENEEELQKMGYFKKTPVFIGSTQASFDVNPLLEFARQHYGTEFVPVLLDSGSSKQLEKMLFSKAKELSRISEFVNMRDNNPQSMTQVLTAALKVKSIMGTKDFSLKMFVERTKHTFTNAKDLLLLLYVCGFVVKWQNKGNWYYKVIDGPGEFEKFAQQRIKEATQQIAELMLFIKDIESAVGVSRESEQSSGSEQLQEALKTKKKRKPSRPKEGQQYVDDNGKMFVFSNKKWEEQIPL